MNSADISTARRKLTRESPLQNTSGGGFCFLEFLAAAILVLALLLGQVLLGGARLIFALPAYTVLILGALAGLFALRLRRPEPDRACFWAAALFFGYVLGRAALSPAPYLARTDIMSVLAGLLVYFLTSCVVTNAKARMWILACLLFATLAHVCVGAIQFRNGNNFMPISFLQRFDYGRRASGFYGCPNHLAGLLEVLGIFGLSMVCWSRWPAWGKILIGYATVVCYFGVLITGSRGGYLSVATSLLVFAFLSGKLLSAAGGVKLTLKVGVIATVASLVALTAVIGIIYRSDALTERTTTTLAAKEFRFTAWHAALDQWQLRPIVGTGSRTYLFYGRLFRSERMQRDPVYAHNDYLQLMAEYGLIGLAAFLLFLGAHLRRGAIEAARLGPKRVSASRRLPSNAMALNIGALCAISAYVVHSFFDFNLHIPANVLLMAFVFGIVANAGVNYDGAPLRLAPSLVIGRMALAFVALFLGWLIWRCAAGEYYGELSRVALRDYRFLTAINYAQKAAKAEPDNPDPFYYLGRARVLGGDVEKNREAAGSFYRAAIPAFERAISLSPLDETYPIELALTYDLLGRFPEAEWLYYKARELDPRSESLKEYYRAHIEQWQGKSPAAKG